MPASRPLALAALAAALLLGSATLAQRRHAEDFRLGAFHDQLPSYGSLPLSVVQWPMLEDSTAVELVSR